MRGCRADEVPLRVCLELESNTLDPLFLVGNTGGFVAEKGEIKGKAHNENEEQAIRITRQDTHFPVASQARQSLRVGRQAYHNDCKMLHNFSTNKKANININKVIVKYLNHLKKYNFFFVGPQILMF